MKNRRGKGHGKAMFRQAAIIGVGLLGASLAMGIRKHGLAAAVVGIYRRKSSLVLGRSLRLHDRGVLGIQPEVLRSSDLIVLACPVRQICELIPEIAPHLSPGAVVMDVGSTKSDIGKAAKRFPNHVDFAGCHPMAGSDRSGPEYGDPDLFTGSLCFLLKDTKPRVRRKIKAFWTALGAHTVLIGDRQHDRITAKISHLPHLAASALLVSLCAQGAPDLIYGGAGLRDTLRVAGSNPRMWRDIFLTNPEFILKELRGFMKILRNFEAALQKRDSNRLFRMLERSWECRKWIG